MLLVFPRLEGSDGRGDEGVALARCAVIEVENDAGFAFVFDTLAAFDVGCYNRCHELSIGVW